MLTSPSIQIRELEAKTSLITARIRSLRNRSSPAASAPSDILGTIFQLLQTTLIETPEQKLAGTWLEINSYRFFFRWLKVARVCQHWRYVAITSPFLWNNVVVTEDYLAATEGGLSPVQMCLQRSALSNSLRVHIHWNLLKQRNMLQLSQVLSQLPRMQYLNFVGAVVTYPSKLFEAGASRLTVLSLDMPWTHKPTIHTEPVSRFLCANHLPSLRSLAVSNFHTYPKIHAPSLRQLQLQVLYESEDRFQYFPAFLRDLPLLEDLMFIGSKFPASMTTLSPEDMAHLSNLKRLAFRSCTRARVFLASVQLPAGVCLTWWNTAIADILPRDVSHLANIIDLSSCTLAYPPEKSGDCLVSAVGSRSAMRGHCWNYYGPQDPNLDLSALMRNMENLYVTGVIQVHTNAHF